MKNILLLLFIPGVYLISLNARYEPSVSDTYTPDSTTQLANASDPFDVMMQVVTHQRCMNCHPAGDRPHQGDDSHIHYFEVQRGENGHGLKNLQCNTCHQSGNNDFSGVPGAPHWHLAPRSMAWEGLSRIEIAQAILNKSKNGNRSVEEIEKHLTEDPLVLWVFDPGLNNEGTAREKPPVSKEDYIKAVKEWVAAGAKIPTE